MKKLLALCATASALCLAHGAGAQVTVQAGGCQTSSPASPGWSKPMLADQYGNVCVNNIGGGGGGGGSSTPVAPYQATPLGYQRIAATSSVVTLTIPATSTFAIISVEGADARWTDDGTTPSTTAGMPIYVGSRIQFSGDLNALKLAAQAAGTTSYSISYYK